MTLNRFASIESRLNSAIGSHLSNAIAVFGGGEPFGVDFGRERSADPFGGAAIDAADFRVSFDSAKAPGIVEGADIVIDDVIYTIAGGVQPDQSGWVSLTVYPKV